MMSQMRLVPCQRLTRRLKVERSQPNQRHRLWALGLGGVGIVIGLWTWGWKVIKTVGEKITELTPSRGFCAEFAAAITILLASVLPVRSADLDNAHARRRGSGSRACTWNRCAEFEDDA